MVWGCRRSAGRARASPRTGVGELLVDDVARVVVVHRELFEDHAALGLDVSSVSRRAEVTMSAMTSTAIGRSVVEHPGVVAGVLLAGGGVGLTTDGVERPRRCPSRCGARCP